MQIYLIITYIPTKHIKRIYICIYIYIYIISFHLRWDDQSDMRNNDPELSVNQWGQILFEFAFPWRGLDVRYWHLLLVLSSAFLLLF